MGQINRDDMLELTRRCLEIAKAISPVDEEQVPHSPETGFLYPAFLSPNVANVLVQNFGIAGITNVEDDIKALIY